MLDFTIMGIVNVTPDSFSDGGRFFDAVSAVEQALTLQAQGAEILDIGGESTRPGAEPVAAQEECRRVVPVIEALVSAGVKARISVDTSKAEVAERALAAGATLVNDVTALRAAPEMAELTARASCTWLEPHARCRTTPSTRTSSQRSSASSRSACDSRLTTVSPRIGSSSIRDSASARRSPTTSSC
jgi:dihydropteroate synthase